ncbi:2Fe-2S iron-sulfur cluster binding domain-containing protein [Paroceanicella profunda]|uniref:2Fe-2S iron-sulfur cluster binding domain-containing protein n=1 Tax=Paroceanicella profunda TaxID=2579971 RepID=A0A5B8FXI7_9RHOB|nr:2Fe-2S iron-sulfur cluster-binding protein [Paroceanicella profunda]QDL91930.1 2Fe-2S iron-sulfur cluster binding domain-containing protein [Paroceanicella profunda]
MQEFFPLTVTDIAHDTRDAVVLSLAPRAEDMERFRFRPGQYLTFRRSFDGAELRRSYSICAAPGEGLRVGIKRVSGGAFSGWAKSDLAVGDTIEAMPPQGRFGPGDTAPGVQARHYIGFAAGSGITPVLSIARTILGGDPEARFTLVYGNRAVASVMFRAELGELKDRYLSRFSVLHLFSGPGAEEGLFSGRIDAGKCAALFGGWLQPAEAEMAFICGPEAMMKEVAGALEGAGLPRERIRFELFGADQPGRAKLRAEAAAARASGDMVRATVIIDGAATEFQMPRRGQSVLEAAREHDIDAPFSCKAGVCSTCIGRVHKGEVEMLQNYALEDYEVARGLVLTCQCIPLSDEIVIEYEGH